MLDILAPEGIKAERLIVVGAGKPSALKEKEISKFGGAAAGKLNGGSHAVSVIAELPDGCNEAPIQAAAIASGIRLRAYKFDRYKTKKKDGESEALSADVSIAVGDVAAAKKAFATDLRLIWSTASSSRATSSTNRRTCFTPSSSAPRPASCTELGVEVEVLDVKEMKKLGMGALLGVAQGSARRAAWS